MVWPAETIELIHRHQYPPFRQNLSNAEGFYLHFTQEDSFKKSWMWWRGCPEMSLFSRNSICPCPCATMGHRSWCVRTDASGDTGQRSEQNSLSPIQWTGWFWTEVTSLVLKAGWIMSPDGRLFQHKRGNSYLHLQEQTCKCTFLVLLPLCLCTKPEKRLCWLCRRQASSSLHLHLCVPSPWEAFLILFSLDSHHSSLDLCNWQGRTLEPIISICPHTVALLCPKQLPGDVCGSDPAATSCRSLPRGSSKLLLLSCCRAPDSSFSAWIENCF